MVRKKINHVQLLPLLSGVQRVSLNEISQLNDYYDYSLTVGNNGDLTYELDKINVQSYIVTHLKRDISIYKDLLAFFQLYALFKENEFDIVHTHSSKTGFLGRVAAKISGVEKVIHTVHGFAFPGTASKLKKFVYYGMEWLAVKFTDHLIVLNITDYNIAVSSLGFKEEKVTIIPNSVDTSLFCKKQSESFNLKSHLKIVVVGRLWKQKNPMCLLKAATLLKSKGVTISIDFIGDGELKTDMEEFIEQNKLCANVKIIGWSNAVHEILTSYDLFILPSLWEGMPLAILEAMSSGLPCIVSDIPGNRDLITDSYNGILFRSNDYVELANSILVYDNNRQLLSRHGENSRNTAVNKYSIKKRNLSISKIYNS